MIEVIYEVSLSIKNEIFADYYAWLVEHSKQILTYEGFKDAKIQRLVDQSIPEHTNLVVSYTLDSMTHLGYYLTNHAAAMRKEGFERVGDKFSATRRVLEVEHVLIHEEC
ncbi:MAG: DUF4286 family protein [Gammaproteobacteria bacterium]